MDRKPNKQNLLLTHWENATLPHRVRSQYCSYGLTKCTMNMVQMCSVAQIYQSNFQEDYVIEYKRINHYDFKFLLKMRNPNRVEKKVIIRLWLVPTKRTSSKARYHPTTGFVNILNLVNFNYSMLGHFTGHTTPKKQLPLTVLSSS